MTYALEIHGLSVRTPEGQPLVRCSRLTAERGSVVALVGPSGSGKTTLLRSIAGALPGGGCRVEGNLSVLGMDPLALPAGALRELRRRHVAFVGQDPASRLSPRMRIGRLVAEAADGTEATGQHGVQEVLAEVGLPVTREFLRRRPGELSGGQQRRVALARALVRRPGLLVLDEPTAGVDPLMRDRLGRLLRATARQHGTTVVLACHEPSVVEQFADTVVDLTPHGPAITKEPRLWSGVPTPPTGHPEILRAEGLSAWADAARRTPVLDGVGLSLDRGGALAVVGVSGAGKTTLGRVITGLHHSAQGNILLDGERLPLRVRQRSRARRRRIQLVPQDPLGTLNPGRTVGATLARPLRMNEDVPAHELPGRIAELLDAVGLSEGYTDRYPHELSGGQRQRVAISRALAASADVLVCDEITSSLDSRTADGVLDLLGELRSRRGLSLIVISHDIPLVARHTDSVLVLDEGRAVESGATGDVLREAAALGRGAHVP